MDQTCRYKENDNKTTAYLTHVIIIDQNIVEGTQQMRTSGKESYINLLRHFENPNDVLILIAEEDQIEAIRNNSIQVTNKISASVYHQINFKCEMLKDESSVTGIIWMIYIITLILWVYRNTYHYPRTMTVLHKLLTVPLILKLILMMTNYGMLYLWPWYSGNLKMYIILAKILLNLIFETILIGAFFLIAFGFKIARNNISVRSFITMLVGMLANYLVIFILMVFNEFIGIGTILYTWLNICFLVFLSVTSLEIIEKLQVMRDNAINNRQPEAAVNLKISMMYKSIAIIVTFFTLEIFYHGVLGVFGVPSTRYQEKMFYIVHESTDWLLLVSLMFILRAKDYIPYFGIINLDEENVGYNEVEFQQFNDVETLTWAVTQRYNS